MASFDSSVGVQGIVPTSINELIKSNFNGCGSRLKVCYLNARSVPNSIDELRNFFINTNIDLICVTETWLKDEISNKAVEIQGYNLFRLDRAPLHDKDRGGGVCVYAKNQIKCKQIKIPSSYIRGFSSQIECLFLEVTIDSNNKFLLAVIYNPPRQYRQMSSSLTDLEKIFSYFSSAYSSIVFTGDFNFDLLKQNAHVTRLRNSLYCHDLHLYNSCNPTHFSAVPSVSSSLLDLIISNDVENLSHFKQIPISISDHDLLLFSMNMRSVSTNSYIYFRDYKNIDMDVLLRNIDVDAFERILYCADVSDQVNIFSSTVLQLFNSHVPLRKRRIREGTAPWLNTDIKVAMFQRDSAYNAWRALKSNSQADQSSIGDAYDCFKRKRNTVVSLVRVAKSNYYKNKFDPTLPPKTFWNNVRTLGIGKCQGNKFVNFSPDEMNSQFCSVFGAINVASSMPDQLSSFDENAFSFRNITEDELVAAIYSVKSEAVGLDGVPLRFIKIILPYISKYLLHIFNSSLSSSMFPSLWKLSMVIPIGKNKNPVSISDFRPISILSSVSKALEIIIKNQINEHLVFHNLLSKFQSGYRAHHGTVSALLNICDDIRRNMDNKHMTVLVLLDFSKAFDSLDYTILYRKLVTKYNFSRTAALLILSYLTQRSQCVNINNSLSNFLNIFSGVPQGSVLGPVLFSIFIDDITESILNCICHLYADDLQIYRYGDPKNPNDCIKLINSDLEKIASWARRNNLKLNEDKTKVIVIYKHSINTDTFPPVILNGNTISYSDTVKNLGLILNKTLTWDDHINQTSRRIYSILRSFRLVAGLASSQFKRKLFLAFIFPHFIYCDLVLYGMSAECERRVKLLFNACIRFVYNLRKYDHVSHLNNSLIGCDIFIYFKFRVCYFILHLLKVQQPLYLYNKINQARSFSRTHNLVIDHNFSLSSNRSLFVDGIMLWNSLPFDIKTENNRALFLNKFLEWYLNTDFTRSR